MAAGGKYAFAETFGQEPEMVYEISHNLVQEEHHPDLFDRPVWVHRKGATRALPAGQALLQGTPWQENRGRTEQVQCCEVLRGCVLGYT